MAFVNIRRLKVEVHFGLVHQSIREAHLIADRVGVPVEITCNGLPMTVQPWSDPEQTIRDYEARVEARRHR